MFIILPQDSRWTAEAGTHNPFQTKLLKFLIRKNGLKIWKRGTSLYNNLKYSSKQTNKQKTTSSQLSAFTYWGLGARFTDSLRCHHVALPVRLMCPFNWFSCTWERFPFPVLSVIILFQSDVTICVLYSDVCPDCEANTQCEFPSTLLSEGFLSSIMKYTVWNVGKRNYCLFVFVAIWALFVLMFWHTFLLFELCVFWCSDTSLCELLTMDSHRTA